MVSVSAQQKEKVDLGCLGRSYARRKENVKDVDSASVGI